MKNKKRKICVLVLNRSEYSRLKRLIESLLANDSVELVVVTLKSRFANNELLFKHDNLPVHHVVRVDVEERILSAMPRAIGQLVERFGNIFHKEQPDIVVIHGDRYEAMAGALAAMYNNIFIAHIQGGEVTGTADEHLRHAITKLSQFHLPSTLEARDRIIKLGEKEDSVVCVGCPGIDLLLSAPKMEVLELGYELYRSSNNRPEVLEKFNGNYILLMQSSVTTEANFAEDQIRATLKALASFDLLKIVLLPNPDAGGDSIERAIREFCSERDDFILFKHFPSHLFINLMRHARVLVGNSSAGIRESGYFGVPTINIGTRQFGRERSENIIDVPYDEKEIAKAVQVQLEHGAYPAEQLYGDGQAVAKIVDVLLRVDYGNIQKHINY